MSYSFSVIASTKLEAKQKIAESFDKVVSTQAPHASDRDAAVACAQSFVDTLVDPSESEEVLVIMSGSLGWRDSASKEFTSASLSANAQIRKKAE